MPRFIKRQLKKAGASPGTLVHVGEQKVDETRITLIDYDEAHLEERVLDDIEEAFPLKDLPTVTWINIEKSGSKHEDSVQASESLGAPGFRSSV